MPFKKRTFDLFTKNQKHAIENEKIRTCSSCSPWKVNFPHQKHGRVFPPWVSRQLPTCRRSMPSSEPWRIMTSPDFVGPSFHEETYNETVLYIQIHRNTLIYRLYIYIHIHIYIYRDYIYIYTYIIYIHNEWIWIICLFVRMMYENICCSRPHRLFLPRPVPAAQCPAAASGHPLGPAASA